MENTVNQLNCPRGVAMAGQAVTDREACRQGAAIRGPQFVGRPRELSALADALARPPAVVLVEGEAGIGKSRLIQAYLGSTAGGNHHAVTAGCPPFIQPLTLGPVTDALKQAAGQVADLRFSGLAGVLRPLFPEWATALPPAPDPLDDPTAARHRLFRALDELLGCLSVDLLVVEDVHWADETTLEFLLFLAARSPQRVSLLVSYRPEDVPDGSLLRRLSSRLPAGTASARITLGPLDTRGTTAMVSSMLDDDHVSEEFAEFVHSHTDGSPLAIVESIRLMADRADLIRRGGEWARRRQLDKIPVPPTVRDAVLERTARLGPAEQAILRAASVLAEPMPERVLAVVAELPDGEAGRGLSGAVACGLLAEDDRARVGGVVGFHHALAARAVYEAMPGLLRRELHLRAARALEGLPSMPAAHLARHFREAGRKQEWLRHAEHAADIALASGDESTAAALLHDLVVHGEPPVDAVARLIRKTPLAALSGYHLLTELMDRLRAILDREDLNAVERAEIGFHLGLILVHSGDYKAGAEELEDAIPGLMDRPLDAAHAMIYLGWPSQGVWPAPVHRRWLDKAQAAIKDPSIPPVDRLALNVNRVSALLDLGEEAGWAAAAELPGETDNPAQWRFVVAGWLNTGDSAIRWGRYGQARERLTAASRLADQCGYPRMNDLARTTLAHLDWFTGAWTGLADRVAALAEADDPLIRLDSVLVAGFLDAAAGDYRSATEKLQQVHEAEAQRGLADLPIEPAAALARLRLDEGKAGDALALTDEPIHVIKAKGIWLWATDAAPVRAAALAAVGRLDEAAELAGQFAQGLRGRNAPAPQAALQLCSAVVAAGQDRHAEAAELFARAATAWADLPRPYAALLARERQGGCLLAAGQPQAGLSVLGRVFRGLSELGASGDAERVVRLLRSHGVHVPRLWRHGRRGYGSELSPREAEVVRLVVAGHSTQEISRQLCRSANTVRTQVRSAMRKLNAPSRTALAARAIAVGLVTDEP
jgi:DNA-binding CsgD family transcriptional regulator/tetratricopeptide (TPR) repeat protein